MKWKKGKKKSLKNIYAFGTGMDGITNHYIKSPDEAIIRDRLAMAKANYEAANNPWLNAMQLVGNVGLQLGSSADPKGAAIANVIGGSAQILDSFATGGKVNNKVPVEIEGEEVIEEPNGEVSEIEGKSHEEGGIDMNLPAGTEVFSKRLMSYGKTMAERKIKREKKEKTLKQLLEDNPYDMVAKRTFNKVKKSNEEQEQQDMKIQQLIAMLGMLSQKGNQQQGMQQNQQSQQNQQYQQQGQQQQQMQPQVPQEAEQPQIPEEGQEEIRPKFLPGGIVPKIPGTSPDEVLATLKQKKPTSINVAGNLGTSKGKNFNSLAKGLSNMGKKSILGNFTGGDWVSVAGDLVNTFGPMLNTKANRAGDLANVNFFRNYGTDALNKIEKAKDYINAQRDNQLFNLERNMQTTTNSNRKTARGVNTMRALDLASSEKYNKARQEVNNNYNAEMTKLAELGSRISMYADAQRMKGEADRFTANVKDRDAYFSNMAQDILSMGQGLQNVGKDINSVYQRRSEIALQNQLSRYGVTRDQYGNITLPPNVDKTELIKKLMGQLAQQNKTKSKKKGG